MLIKKAKNTEYSGSMEPERITEWLADRERGPQVNGAKDFHQNLRTLKKHRDCYQVDLSVSEI